MFGPFRSEVTSAWHNSLALLGESLRGEFGKRVKWAERNRGVSESIVTEMGARPCFKVRRVTTLPMARCAVESG
jgi:hypothetical protein